VPASISHAQRFVFVQAAPQQIAHFQGRRSGQRLQVGLSPNHGSKDVPYVLAVKRLLPGQHFLPHPTEGPGVGPSIYGFAPRLLRAYVRGRAQNHFMHRRRHAQRR